MHVTLAVITAAAFLRGASACAATADGWWVWQPGESVARRNPDGRLYWHAATLPAGAAAVRWAEPPAGEEVVPVLRLEGGAAAMEALWMKAAERVVLQLAGAQRRMVQLDFDCPVRLLPEYAAWLRGLRGRIAPVKLSVTALAGWAPLDAALWKDAVDEMAPMFYDLWPDEPSAVLAGSFQPLADAAKTPPLLARWKDCPVPWRCGLADFVRVSRFSTSGKLAGHLRAWKPESLLFAEEFGRAEPLGPGVWRLPVLRETVAAQVAWKAGDVMIVRRPDTSALATLTASAKAAGALGVVWFQWPSGKGSDGWSPSHLAVPESPWQGRLKREAGRLVLHGAEKADLPQQWEGVPRGWLLELDAPAAWFRDAGAGDFFRMESRNAAGERAAPALATRMGWRFAALPAGGSLGTGPLTLAPAADWGKIRWRVTGPGLSPEWSALP